MAVLESFFSRSHEGHRLECQTLQHTNHWFGFLFTQIFLFIDRTNLSRWREFRSVSEENPSCFDSSDRDIDVVLILEEANKFHLCKTALLCVYSVFSRSCKCTFSNGINRISVSNDVKLWSEGQDCFPQKFNRSCDSQLIPLKLKRILHSVNPDERMTRSLRSLESM